mgnify:CR=1 FL=1
MRSVIRKPLTMLPMPCACNSRFAGVTRFHGSILSVASTQSRVSKLATLAITPLREWTGLSALARLRRMLGNFAFFYGVLHFVSYAWLDMGLVWADIVRDIPKRPFVLVGTLALLLMAPLAATSFNRAIKALGAARWQALHRCVYAIVLLGLLHFFWMRAGKNDFAEWSVYAVLVAALLGRRVHRRWLRAAPTRA